MREGEGPHADGPTLTIQQFKLLLSPGYTKQHSVLYLCPPLFSLFLSHTTHTHTHTHKATHTHSTHTTTHPAHTHTERDMHLQDITIQILRHTKTYHTYYTISFFTL